jgi:hypothetical protein
MTKPYQLSHAFPNLTQGQLKALPDSEVMSSIITSEYLSQTYLSPKGGFCLLRRELAMDAATLRRLREDLKAESSESSRVIRLAEEKAAQGARIQNLENTISALEISLKTSRETTGGLQSEMMRIRTASERALRS